MNYVLYIPLLPFITFVLLGVFGRKYLSRLSGIIGTTALLVATVLSLVTAYNYFGVFGKVNGIYEKLIPFKYTWLHFSSSKAIEIGAILDPISVMMITIVTFVSLMVHVFSLGYMKGEKRIATYFSFLSLFTFSMLGLVLSSNLFQVYIFWELVGVSSYLLIGFYYDKPSAVAASKKAFIVTRFADFGFLIGILVLGFYGNTLDIQMLIDRLTTVQSSHFIAISTATFLGVSALTWGLTLVFVGGAGKSAMFPLHIWLPDAMEGPTPVSALIHAATMVVAGVYLVARLFPIFSTDPAVLNLVTWVGAFSAVIAAIIACTQDDIKRVLAYSTMSQIGYMMLALGLSQNTEESGIGFTASMFHLFTHAFFKSLLFLGAGVVIHLVHANDLSKMGGLRKLMPLTHFAFLVACLAIAGIPPFAGFFSKEEILLTAFQANKAIYFLALFTAALTAFYMFRLYFSIFWRRPTFILNEGTDHHVNGDGRLTMKVPLVILSFCTIGAGLLPFSKYVTSNGAPINTHLNILFSIAPVTLSVFSILLAAWLYKKENDKAASFVALFSGFYTAAKRKFYIDELYVFITRNLIYKLVGRPAAWFDRNIIDGCMNGLAYITSMTSNKIKTVQSGSVQNYALYFFAGIAALAIVCMYLL